MVTIAAKTLPGAFLTQVPLVVEAIGSFDRAIATWTTDIEGDHDSRLRHATMLTPASVHRDLAPLVSSCRHESQRVSSQGRRGKETGRVLRLLRQVNCVLQSMRGSHRQRNRELLFPLRRGPASPDIVRRDNKRKRLRFPRHRGRTPEIRRASRRGLTGNEPACRCANERPKSRDRGGVGASGNFLRGHGVGLFLV
jgi:hypothetical protein